MSYQNKGFFMAKGGGHLTDRNAFDNSSRIEPKRSHQWFADAAEAEIFPNKKQSVQAPNSKSTAGLFNANASTFQSVSNQFIDRLFGSETTGTVNFDDRNMAHFGSDNSNTGNKGIIDQFGNDSRVGLTLSPTSEDPQTCLNYGRIKKLKVNQVKDSNNGLHDLSQEHNRGISMGHMYNPGNETSFMPTNLAYSNEDVTALIMGPADDRSIASSSKKESGGVISISHNYTKDDTTTISFGGFHDEPDVNLLARPISYVYDQPSVQKSETSKTVASASQGGKSRSEALSKVKTEVMSRKEAPNSFPSNVRSLISTGMLDGVHVKYVSLSRQEMPGIIQGSGYLCGCQLCNYSKVLNAYEFERHAGSKTKHPNNHIYFMNGKTIYQIVQELRSTPESLLFDTMQTVTGSPINQKPFRAWRESFQAASRELERIYGREGLDNC